MINPTPATRLAGDSALRLSANLSLLFTDRDFGDRPQAAARAGFDAVEFWPTDDVDAGISAAQAANIPVALLNVPTGEAGEHGRLIYRESMEWWRGMFLKTLRQAEITGCRRITLITGNCDPDADRREYDRVLRENLEFALDAVRGTDIVLLLEPLNANDRPHHYLLTLEHAIAIVTEFDSANLRILFDAYHLAQSQHDLVGALTASLPHVGYIQIADVPGRHEPGTGTIPFGALMRAALDGGYVGHIGCEYAPKTTTAESLPALKLMLGVTAAHEGETHG